MAVDTGVCSRGDFLQVQHLITFSPKIGVLKLNSTSVVSLIDIWQQIPRPWKGRLLILIGMVLAAGIGYLVATNGVALSWVLAALIALKTIKWRIRKRYL